MTTTVYLVRHGETEGNREGRVQPYETPLSRFGLAQAQLVAERLAAEGPFSALYTSDLLRARQTAAIVSAALGLKAMPDRHLRELDAGDWKGYLHADVGRHFAYSRDEWVAGGGLERLPGIAGESTTDVVARVSAAFWDAVRAHPAERVILVSHGWALMLLLASLFGEDHAGAFREQRRQLANTSVTVFEAETEVSCVCSLLNCTRHLEGTVWEPEGDGWGVAASGSA